MSSESFGTRLRRLREHAGLTQQELAERAGMSPKAIGALERGQRTRPYPHTVRALAAALGLGAEERAALKAEVPARRRRGSRQGNLPAQVTSFVGRSGALEQIRATLGSTRLLSVIGPGGVGKTRVALRAAAELQAGFSDGAWLVELAGLGVPSLVPKAVMTALGMRDQAGGWSAAGLGRHLAGRRLLLVLDNCEHLLDACAGLADVLLREAPGVSILATSRQPLGVAGERVIPLAPLTLPGPAAIGPDDLERSDSIALFVERAAEATGDFVLTPSNQQVVLELCRRLDGMPLAIELAAVRLRALGVEQILERLNDRFRLLTGGSRAALPRQQTLRATIEWSYDLLGDDERAVLRRLSVFAGGFELEAAEAVCAATGAAPDGVLDPVSRLVEKSVVSREGTEVTARYRLHETMREYAWLRLTEAGEAQTAVDAHLGYYLALSRRADREWFGPRLVGWLNRFDLEADDIRAALQRSLSSAATTDHGLEIAGHLWFYWMSRAVGEGVHWVERLLKKPGGAGAVRARALLARGAVAMHQPDLVTGVRVLTEAADLARRVGDTDTLAQSLGCMAVEQALTGDLMAARASAHALTELAVPGGPPPAMSWAAQARGIAYSYGGDLDSARPEYDRLAAISRDHGEAWMLSYGYLNLGFGLLMRDRADGEAAGRLEDALRLKRVLDDRPGIGYALVGLACRAAAIGEARWAAVLIGAIATLHREDGTKPQEFMVPYIEEARERALTALGRARFVKACAEGEQFDREAAIAFALHEPGGGAGNRATATDD